MIFERIAPEQHDTLDGVPEPSETLRLIGAGRREAIVDADIAAFRPAEVLEPLPECREASLGLGVVLGVADEHPDPPYLAALLRTRRERQHGRRAAEQGDELAPLQER